MKKILTIIGCCVVMLLTGCATTPGKLIATSSTTVDHAMKAWAVYVVDGNALPAQELQVREYKRLYDLAEDAAVQAYIDSSATGDKLTWAKARDYLFLQQQNLINLVSALTGKAL